MIIETKRLILRKFTIDDAKAMFNNWASDSEVTKFLTWHPHQNIEITKMILNMWIEEYDNPNTYRLGLY